ncbi:PECTINESTERASE INHIBITOR-LIKE [Salix viminalis]|uniref:PECTINESTERASE INHIBITOR-LIKE n=1 Tax=Salix viminalis TaxID=40686 RepID=A0A9Q0T7K0_SALVM|nr:PECTINESTERASE INHIBITOR-LIKE [Salix viminalis]
MTHATLYNMFVESGFGQYLENIGGMLYQTILALAKMIPSLFPVLLLLLISASQCSATLQHKQPDLIEKSCSIIAGYEDCVRILRSDRRAIKATNVKELAYIILDLCIANATVTLGEVPKLREKYKKDGKIEKALRRCAVEYKKATKVYFRKAVEQLGKKSYLEAQNLAHIGGALGTSCEQEFYFQAPEFSPLWPRNHDLAVLGTVAEGIVSLLRLKKS